MGAGAFFSCCMMVVSASVVTTVLVLNLHYRTADMYEMSHWVTSFYSSPFPLPFHRLYHFLIGLGDVLLWRRERCCSTGCPGSCS